VLVEVSTESEWVARCLEEFGHEVIVADPNYAPTYAQQTRRVKTDRRDVQALAHACRLGAARATGGGGGAGSPLDRDPRCPLAGCVRL
jgi:hypothetical protein